MVNLINAERVTVSYGTHSVLREVSLGLGNGDSVGVVGRKGTANRMTDEGAELAVFEPAGRGE